MRPRTHLRAALALAVGLVLADSSVVVLALPDIYRELDVSVSTVVWVLIAFNLVLAAAAVPAAHLAGAAGPARLTVAGLGLFAAASLACGLAPGIEVLIGARCLQALGGAAAVCASLELMPAVYGAERTAARAWATAGAVGAALGPAVGGLLTELISWQAIFLFQVPVAVAVLVPLLGVARGERDTGGRAVTAGRPHLAANAALALVSAALAAALFLVVLLLIEGWRLSPIAAAAAVSVLPACALLATPVARRVAQVEARAAAGVILIAGGLAGLALLPKASVALTLPPQAVIGVGLALTLSALTEAALAGRSSQAIHGGWTIAARHAGVVAGLLVLTPVFTGDLETEREDAEQAGTAALLDARLPTGGQARARRADRGANRGGGRQGAGDRPGVRAPARGARRANRDRCPARRDRGAGRSRCNPRLQLLVPDRRRIRPLGVAPDRARPAQDSAVSAEREKGNRDSTRSASEETVSAERMSVSGRTLILAAVGLSAALVVAYLAAGGGDYEPTPVADPCAAREWRDPEGIEESAEQFALSALDGAACELGVSRETLAVALSTSESRAEFAAEYGVDEAELEAAVRAGMRRGIDDAEAAGALSPTVAAGLRAAAEQVPVEEALAVIEDAGRLFESGGGLVDGVGELLP